MHFGCTCSKYILERIEHRTHAHVLESLQQLLASMQLCYSLLLFTAWIHLRLIKVFGRCLAVLSVSNFWSGYIAFLVGCDSCTVCEYV